MQLYFSLLCDLTKPTNQTNKKPTLMVTLVLSVESRVEKPLIPHQVLQTEQQGVLCKLH